MSLLAARSPGPLRHRDFRWLCAGVTVDSFGSALTPVALAFAVLDLGGSATQLGLVVAAFALAEVLTTLFGGVLGDRVPRTRMMAGSALASGAVQAVVAAALFGHFASVPFLSVTAVVGGVASALGRPSSGAITPSTVPPDQVGGAVALRRLGSNTAMIVGYGVAGLLVAALGSAVAIAVDAVTFAVAAGCYARIGAGRAARGPQARHRASLPAELRAGAAEVVRHTWLWVLIAQALLYHLVYGGVQGVIGPVVVGQAFGRAAWGWSLAALMSGFVTGGFVTLWWRPRRALAVGVTALSLTACFPLAIAVQGHLVTLLLGAFLHGLGLEVFSVWWDVSIQQAVPPDRLARVNAFDTVGSFVMRPLGLAVAGPVTSALGTRSWLLAVAALMGGSSLLALLVPDVRRLERR